MPILVSCNGCNAKLNAPDTAAGKKIRCPKCQNVIDVPGTSPEAIAPSPVAPAPGSEPPPIPSTPQPSPVERAYDDYDDRPRKKKKRRREIPSDAPNKMVCGLMALLLGWLGIHKFMLGYTGAGLTMLLVSVLTCGVGYMIMAVIGFIEGIIYLTKSDEEFYEIYVLNRKEWF